MLTVYAIPESLYCAKLRIVLRHKGLEWQELPPPGGYGSAEYKAMVPAGNLPTLRHGDTLIADSEAIGEYLNEVYPEPPMLPGTAAERAAARARSRFHDTRLEPAVRRLFDHIGKAPDPTSIAAKGCALSLRLAQLAALLQNAPAGPALTLGDCGLPVTAVWIDALTPVWGVAIDWPQPLRSYLLALERHPAVAAELASYRPILAAWLAAETQGS